MSELLRRMLEGFFRNPLDGREMVLATRGGKPLAGVVMVPMNASFAGENYLHLKELRALSKGGGRAALKLLTRRADELCATIGADVEPFPSHVYGMRKMPKRQMLSWYREFGFTADRSGAMEIVRYPDPARCPSPTRSA